ncbi:tape measure protein [Brevundimonas sp. 2R-24]|uniref:Tape measure protein n=1 Tax=Peiella sedimenti TaxID=3061083 RepID=A0ABT8SMP5_9CAUL|nr:tape measure protein [Caulobacteraceae bacterium XZ-24]
MAGAFIAAFGANQIVGLTDSYTRFTNALRVAGLQGEDLATVQQSLFDQAQRTGTALEPLGQLYGRASAAAVELGAGQAELLQFTSGVTNALLIQGASTEQASGALLQLSQALAGGTVRAEEYNSVNEGARPILEAVAAGSDRFGGSVSKLGAEVRKGTVSSREFFNAFLAGSGQLEARAQNASTTVAQAIQKVRNALGQFLGQQNEEFGATDRLAGALVLLAENIDLVADALIILATVWAAMKIGRMAQGFANMGTATFGLGAAMRAAATDAQRLAFFQQGMNASMAMGTRVGGLYAGAMRGVTALFGGPLGAAITLTTIGVGFLADRMIRAEAEARSFREAGIELAEGFDQQAEAAARARRETGDLTPEQMEGATAAAALSGETHLLADAHFRAAAAARAQAIAEAQLRETQTRHNFMRAQRDEAAVRERIVRQRMGPTVSGDGRQGVPRGYRQTVEAATAQDSRIAAAQRATAGYREAYRQAFNERVRAENPNTSTWEWDPRRNRPPATNTNTGGGRRGGADDAERRAEARTQAIEQAERAYDEAIWAQARTAVERSDATRARIQSDYEAQAREIASNDDFDAATRDRLNALNEQTRAVLDAAAAEDRANEVRAEAYALQDSVADHETALAQERLEQLHIEADHTRDREARLRIEAQAFAEEQRLTRLQHEADLRRYELSLRDLRLSEEEISRRLADRRAAFNRTEASREQGFNLSQQEARDRGSWGEWARSNRMDADALNRSLQNLADNGINGLIDGMLEVIDGSKSMGEALADLAREMLAQMLRIGMQFLIWEGIGMAFGYKGLGAAMLGLKPVGGRGGGISISNASGSAPRIGNNASGTGNWRGGLTMVGEKGPELLNLPSGANITPYSTIRSALSGQPIQGRGGDIHVHTTVVANDAVLTSTVKSWIVEANIQAVQHARAMVAKDQGGRANRSLLR